MTWRSRLGVALLVVGLLGHVLAAKAMGGLAFQYGHHIVGFGLIAVITGAPIAGLGWPYWRRRRDTLLLVIGVVQALAGLAVYVMTARQY